MSPSILESEGPSVDVEDFEPFANYPVDTSEVEGPNLKFLKNIRDYG